MVCFVKETERLSDATAFLEKKGVNISYGDITNEESVKRVFNDYNDITEVIHLAAIIKPNNGDKEFIDVNVDGTQFLVRQCEKHGIKQFIFYSTDFVLYDYHTIYGDSKAQAEEIIKASKLNYTILRPTPVYGLGDDKNFITLFDLVRKFPVLPSVKCIMQPVHVADVVEATIAVLGNSKTYRKAYNLTGGSTVTFAQILKILASEMNCKRLIMPVPNKLLQTAVRIYERVVPRPIVRDYQISKWMINQELSIKENQQDFGYNPVSFEKGMRETMRAMGISRRKEA